MHVFICTACCFDFEYKKGTTHKFPHFGTFSHVQISSKLSLSKFEINNLRLFSLNLLLSYTQLSTAVIIQIGF